MSSSSRSDDVRRRQRGRRLNQLPSGPHGLSPAEVAASQRARLVDAMAEAVGRNGYHDVRVEDVVALAGVSRKTFYDLFGGKEECFEAAYSLALGRLLAGALAAFGTQRDWVDRLRAALSTLLGALAQQPELARVCFVDAALVSGWPASRERLMDDLAVLFDAPEVRERRLAVMLSMGRVSELTELLRREIAAGNAQRLPQLLPQLMYAMVIPFLGPEAAERELDRGWEGAP